MTRLLKDSTHRLKALTQRLDLVSMHTAMCIELACALLAMIYIVMKINPICPI